MGHDLVKPDSASAEHKTIYQIHEILQDMDGKMTALNKAQAVIEFDSEGKILAANERFLKLMGYELDEIVGHHHQIFVDKDAVNSSEYADFWKCLQNGDYREGRYKRLTKDGSEVWIQASYNPVFDLSGKPVKVVKFATDITQETLHNNNVTAQLKALHRVQAVIEFDLDGNILQANDNYTYLTGYRLSEIIGKHHSMFLEPGEEKLDSYKSLWTALKLGRYQEGEFKRISKAGEAMWIQASYNPVLDLNGKAIKVVKFATGITDKKTAERALIKAKEEADRTNLLKSEFLANMSHEIRTPMNGIIGMTELLLGTKMTHKQKNYAHTVAKSADSLLNIINDILDFSKIESGKLDLEPIQFDLMTLVEDVAELLAVKAKEKAIELIVRYVPGTPHFLVGDPGRIRQIINNLAGNAIKFTEKGHVLITVEAEESVPENEHSSTIKISIKDTGIGIPKSAQDLIFDKFSQADNSTTRKFGGTGLGLAISKQLTEMMSGELAVESRSGEGSTFSFTMKLENDVDEKIEINAIKNLQGLRALLVDDIAINGELLGEHFHTLGMDSVYCPDPKNAIKILENAALAGQPFQIAIIDYLMPGIDGEQLAKLITKNDKIPDLALVMLTSAGGGSISKKLKSAGYHAFLNKPLRANELKVLLSNTWKRYLANDTDELITVENLGVINRENLPYRDIQFDGPTILLAEDNRINQELAMEILVQSGFVVEVASDGQKAVELAAEDRFDLVLMDCEMPEMNGFEATEALSQLIQDNRIKSLPIIALTGNAMKGDRQRCVDAGMQDYVTKPIRKAQLLKTLATWLPDRVKQDVVSEYRFDGNRVLLVEDNRINRALAEEILEDIGFSVSTAENGEIAVQKITEDKEIDLILMDCQMPVLDGFEATRAIRSLETEKGLERTPIIALTANAMKGDRERCIEVGMDDHVTKPIKREVLQGCISRWITPSTTASNEADPENELTIDQDIFKAYKDVFDDEWSQSISHFINDSEKILQGIFNAYDQNSLQQLAALAHTFKFKTGALGLHELSDIARLVEEDACIQISSGGKTENITPNLDRQLRLSFAEAREMLENEISNQNAA